MRCRLSTAILFQSSRLLTKRIVQRLGAVDGNRLLQLQIERTVLKFVCFRVRSVFASRRCVSEHVTVSTSCQVNIMAACPGNRMHWDVTVEYIAGETDRLIVESKAVYDAVGALDSSAVTYDNVIKVFLQSVLFNEKSKAYCK